MRFYLVLTRLRQLLENQASDKNISTRVVLGRVSCGYNTEQCFTNVLKSVIRLFIASLITRSTIDKRRETNRQAVDGELMFLFVDVSFAVVNIDSCWWRLLLTRPQPAQT